MKNTVLTNPKDRFLHADPLTHILRAGLKLNPWQITLICVPLLNIPVLLATYINNAWFSSNFIGLFQDFDWWLLQFTTISFITFYFFWIPDGYQKVISGLSNNNVIGKSRNKTKVTLDEFLDAFDEIYSHKAWLLITLAFSIAFSVFIAFPEHSTFKTWENTGGFIFWYMQIFWGLFFFLSMLTGLRLLLVTYSLNNIFKNFNINVRVLLPDGAGGLLPLSEFSVKVGYLVAALGIATVSIHLGKSYILTGNFSGLILTPFTAFLTISYLILSPILFFAPIGSARSAMRIAKDELILQISNQFERDKRTVISKLNAKPNELREVLEKTDQLQKIYNLAKSFPVWPFNSENLTRFFSVIISPIALGVLSLLFDLVRGVFKTP